MPKQFFTALWFKPMAVELAPVEEIVPRTIHKAQDQFGLILVIGLCFIPIEQAIAQNLLLWGLLEVVFDGGSHFGRRRRGKDSLHFVRKGTPVGGWIAALWYAQTNRLQAVFASREFAEEFERKCIKGCRGVHAA